MQNESPSCRVFLKRGPLTDKTDKTDKTPDSPNFGRRIMGCEHRPLVWRYQANRPRPGKDYGSGLAALISESWHTKAPIEVEGCLYSNRGTTAVLSSRASPENSKKRRSTAIMSRSTFFMKTTHILKTSVGVTCEMTFDESTAAFECQWSPPPPYPPADRDQVIAEYLPWRDAIFSEWSQCTGKRVKLLTI